jgi:endonuclease/exonuclease/phosphatase family metal-dependent hydrolase
MTANRPQILLRALVGLLTLGVLMTPALAPSADAAKAKVKDPKTRVVTAPYVFYPLKNLSSVHDLRTSSRKHYGTDITGPCTANVRAAHPGVAGISSAPNLGNYVRVRANGSKGLTTTYGYLSRVFVEPGQIIQAGQVIGQVGKRPGTASCRLWFSVTHAGKYANPSTWLNSYVGKLPPVTSLFGTPGFLIASFNVLGASHTARSSKYANGNTRINRAMSMLNARHIDIVGTQEFQETQFDYWTSRGNGNTWGAFYWDPAGKKRDTENAILYRKSTIEFVSGETYDIPYFHGNTRHVAAALFRERSTGRTFYMMNVHNPANTEGNAAPYRARAIAIEKQKIIDLRATGRPVLFTGDFNDRQKAFCPLTADKLTITPNSIPSTTCVYPKPSSIDWIFAAGQVRFTSFGRDTYPQSARISDHPIVQARAHLQN